MRRPRATTAPRSVPRGVALAIRAAVAAFGAGAGAGVGCGSDAVGIEVCRTIEYARCDAVQVCAAPDYTPPDPTACKELYRDQCLHGIENDEAPQTSQGEACAAAIRS